ncbi:MAG: hypothetical protein MJ071_08980 [Oscillospiraceae bacterium]|nr:hypothetical protein [Oscillospiraceae bacterium]
MTLLISISAAVISTLVWYCNARARNLKIGTLVLMYWGASLMWLVDACAEYIEIGSAYFTPAAADMLNDAFLGFTVVVLGMVIWIASLLIRDPAGTLHNVLSKNH